MEVQDPSHPLFGQRFELASVNKGWENTTQVEVLHGDGTYLRIQVRALRPPALPPLESPLSDVGVRALLDLVECEGP